VRRKYPPGPINWNAAIGLTYRHMLRLWWNPLQFVRDMGTYGDLVFFRMFGVRAYIANHPQLIRDVLIAKREHFRKLPRDVRAVRQLTGNGIIVSEGDLWLRQRRLLQTAFHTRRMTGYAESMVQQTEQLLERWPDNVEVDIAQEMTQLTMRIAAKTMFDLDLTDGKRELVEAAQVLSHAFIEEIRSILTLPDWIPLPSKRRKRWAMQTYDRLIRDVIAQRRAAGHDHGDLLSILLLAVDQDGDGRGMSDEQARDEAMTIFTAAFHANSMALTWTWYLLARHPRIAAQMVEEIERVLGQRRPTYDDVAKLTYTQQVLKESMRLRPPAWSLFCRQVVTPVELGGYRLDPGSWVFIYPYATHHDARFFPDPDRFDPDRFTPEREREMPACAYLPFGAGPRACIGSHFAMAEMTLILALIGRDRQLDLIDANAEPALQASLALRPRGGLPMRVRCRAVANADASTVVPACR
jgi:cytochrome P450